MEGQEIEKERLRKKRNAERNKKNRDKDRDGLNLRRREKRIMDRAIITPNIGYNNEKILKKIEKLPEQKNTEVGKSENTKNVYVSFIRQFYKRRAGEELEEDADIIKKIREDRYSALGVSRQFKVLIEENMKDIVRIPYEVNNLYKIFRGIRGFTEISKTLYPYMVEYGKQYEELRSVAVVEDKNDLEIISFERDEIIKNIERIEDITDRIIYGYIFIIRGRLNDLRLIRIAKDKDEAMKIENNYIYENRLYINNTKNKRPYIIDIPEDFSRLCEGIEEGYILGNLIPPSTLSQRLQRITKEIYGKVYTYLNIRHLNATYINAKGASLKEREETSRQAGHSVEQQLRYVYKIE